MDAKKNNPGFSATASMARDTGCVLRGKKKQKDQSVRAKTMKRIAGRFSWKRMMAIASGLFAMVLLYQSPAWGQSQAPVPVPVRKATPLPMVKAKPQDNGGKPTHTLAAEKGGLPDLQITEVKYEKLFCGAYVRVVNKGIKEAGPFHVWINFVEPKAKWSRYKAATVDRLAVNQTTLVEFHLIGGWTDGLGKCLLTDTVRAHAVADARYLLVKADPGAPTPGGLSKPGSSVPAGAKVVESQVRESNENNNEYVLNKQ